MVSWFFFSVRPTGRFKVRWLGRLNAHLICFFPFFVVVFEASCKTANHNPIQFIYTRFLYFFVAFCLILLVFWGDGNKYWLTMATWVVLQADRYGSNRRQVKNRPEEFFAAFFFSLECVFFYFFRKKRHRPTETLLISVKTHWKTFLILSDMYSRLNSRVFSHSLPPLKRE